MNPRERRAARHQPPNPADEANPRPRRRKALITVEQLIDTALGVIATEGYEALTMRRLAGELDTGSASLYAHVVNKADLDELLIGRLCAELVLPEPDPAAWREQVRGVCAQIRDQYLKYPGISRAALAMAPTNIEIMRVSEGMLAILLAGGVAAQSAAWAVDAFLLYVAAYCLEVSIAHHRAAQDDVAWVLDRDELLRRLRALPAAVFPHTVRHATELTAGAGHDRFDFTLGLMIDGLIQASSFFRADVQPFDMSTESTTMAFRRGDDLAQMTRWREAIDGLRPRMTGRAWRHGERNVARLAKALGVSRDTVYADLREQHIDYRDRKAPVTLVEDDRLDYEFVSERVVDAMVAANVVPIGLRAMADGHDPQTLTGRCQLLESVLPDIDVDEDLVQCEAVLEPGRLDIPDVGEIPVWRGTSVDPDGRTIGWGLLGIPDVPDESPVVLRGVDDLVQVIAAVPTKPASGKPQRCLIHTYVAATGPGIQWGTTTVDTVLIGFPIWIYQKTRSRP